MLVSSRGQVQLANSAARALLSLDSESPSDCKLAQLVDDPEDKLAETLRTWSRSTHPTPGSFALLAGQVRTMFNARGSVVILSSGEAPAILLVRFWLRTAANPFLLLN